MKKYKIVLLSGDGIGPEISEVSKKILKKLSKNHNFEIEIIEKLFGGIAYAKYGNFGKVSFLFLMLHQFLLMSL